MEKERDSHIDFLYWTAKVLSRGNDIDSGPRDLKSIFNKGIHFYNFLNWKR
jgi:hypothetical protein